jgi:hypothetical protein
MNQPWVQKNSINNQIIEVSSRDFFNSFESKQLKFGLAIASGTIGVISNYHAVKYQIEHSRFDMVGSDYSHVYAIGFTGFLDLMIILSYLMKDKKLINISVISSLIISIYANLMLHLQTAGGSTFKKLFLEFLDPNVLFSFIVSITMAILPILIVKHCMKALMIQLAEEK